MTNSEALDSFIARARMAAATGSKEMRIPAQEAFELTTAIAALLASNVKLSEQIRSMEQLISSSISVDGGKFP